MKSLLVDLGSTFIKYAVSENGALRFPGRIPFPGPCLDDGVRYHVSVDAIRAAILRVVEETRAKGWQRILFSVQMHGYLLRYEDGCFSDYVSWRDRSGCPDAPTFDGVDFAARGTSRKANLPLVKLAGRTDCELFTLGSYAVWLLTGANVTHITDACASGFYDAATGECLAPFPAPRALHVLSPVGSYRGAAVYPAMGDHPISYLGSGAGEDAYLVNIGTATQMACLDAGAVPASGCEARPWLRPGRWLHTVTGLVGGGELYTSGWNELLWTQLLDAMERLPRRNCVLLGGGGARGVADLLIKRWAAQGIACRLLEGDTGLEGLNMAQQLLHPRRGTMLSEIAFAHFPLIAQNAGLDFLIVDNEHGSFDPAVLAALAMNARLCGLKLIVRAGENGRGYLTRLADMGAGGFLLPMTNGPEDIRQVIDCVKYPPTGRRGVSTTRAHTLYNPPPLAEYMPQANAAMEVYAQIETRRGLDSIRSILAVEGLSGIWIGPNDLSVDLNCGKEEICRCMQLVADAAQEACLPWGIITTDSLLLDCAQRLGANMISYGSELNMLIDGCKRIKEMF